MSTPTRFPELQFRKDAPNVWRIIDAETGNPIGQWYRSKIELLADLERFAAEFGCAGAATPTPAASKEVGGQAVSKLNGIVVSRTGRTIFVPLPRELWVPIEGGCQCGFCAVKNDEGDKIPGPAFWDTLAVSTQDLDRHTWTVHAPELHNGGAADFERRHRELTAKDARKGKL